MNPQCRASIDLLQPLLPSIAGPWHGSAELFAWVLDGSRNSSVTLFFLDSQMHPTAPEGGASLHEVEAVGVLRCPPGISEIAFPAHLWKEPQIQECAEKTLLKSAEPQTSPCPDGAEMQWGAKSTKKSHTLRVVRGEPGSLMASRESSCPCQIKV